MIISVVEYSIQLKEGILVINEIEYCNRISRKRAWLLMG